MPGSFGHLAPEAVCTPRALCPIMLSEKFDLSKLTLIGAPGREATQFIVQKTVHI